jgi:hypothetical protein
MTVTTVVMIMTLTSTVLLTTRDMIRMTDDNDDRYDKDDSGDNDDRADKDDSDDNDDKHDKDD